MPRSEKQNSDANGELPTGWNQWPGVNEAARLLSTDGAQVSHHFLYQKVAEGALQQILDPTGRKRFNPKDLEELRGYVATADESELEPVPKRSARGISPEEFRAGTELVQNVLKWHQSMVPLMIQGFEAASRRAEEQSNRDREELERQRKRNSELENQLDSTAKERERALHEERDRALQERLLDAQERRKDRVIQTAENKLLPVLLHKWGLTDPKMGLGIKLLSSIKREQLLMLLMVPGVLDEKQTALVLELLGELSAEERAALGKTESDTQGEKKNV